MVLTGPSTLSTNLVPSPPPSMAVRVVPSGSPLLASNAVASVNGIGTLSDGDGSIDYTKAPIPPIRMVKVSAITI